MLLFISLHTPCPSSIIYLFTNTKQSQLRSEEGSLEIVRYLVRMISAGEEGSAEKNVSTIIGEVDLVWVRRNGVEIL